MVTKARGIKLQWPIAERAPEQRQQSAEHRWRVCRVWMAPFLQVPFRAWCFVRSSLVFGLLARRTWPLALMVSTNQVPFRTSNSKRSGQSSGCLSFWTDKVPSLHWSCKLLLFRWSVKSFSLCRVHSVLARPRSYGPFCWPWQQPLLRGPLKFQAVQKCPNTLCHSKCEVVPENWTVS